MFRFFEQRNSSCEDAKIVVNSSRNSCDFDVNVMMRGGREGVGFRRLKGTKFILSLMAVGHEWCSRYISSSLFAF